MRMANILLLLMLMTCMLHYCTLVCWHSLYSPSLRGISRFSAVIWFWVEISIIPKVCFHKKCLRGFLNLRGYVKKNRYYTPQHHCSRNESQSFQKASDTFQLLLNFIFSVYIARDNLCVFQVSLCWYIALKTQYFYCLFKP